MYPVSECETDSHSHTGYMIKITNFETSRRRTRIFILPRQRTLGQPNSEALRAESRMGLLGRGQPAPSPSAMGMGRCKLPSEVHGSVNRKSVPAQRA